MKKLIIISICTLLSMPVMAENCSKLTFVSKDTEKVVELVGLNDKKLFGKYTGPGFMSGPVGSYSFPAGSHAVSISSIDQSYYRELSLKKFAGHNIYIDDAGKIAQLEKHSKAMVFEFDFKPNKHYQFLVDENSLTPVLLKDSYKESCSQDSRYISVDASQQQAQKIELSEQLNFELRKLMFDINHHHASAGAPTNNMNLPHLMYYPGLDVEQNFNGPGLKLRNTGQSILGSILDIENGDILLSMNKKEFNNGDVKELEILINELYFNEKIRATVLRNGQKIELKTVYIPRLVPKYRYDIGKQKPSLVNGYKLPKNLSYRLQMLMAAISAEIEPMQLSGEHIVIEANEALDGSLAIAAKREAWNQGYALHVISLEKGGLGSHMGLQVGDKLITFNNQPFMNKNFERLSAQLASFKQDETFNYSVIRDGKEQYFTSTFKPRVFPEFALSIDTSYVPSINNMLTKSKYGLELQRDFEGHKYRYFTRGYTSRSRKEAHRSPPSWTLRSTGSGNNISGGGSKKGKSSDK